MSNAYYAYISQINVLARAATRFRGNTSLPTGSIRITISESSACKPIPKSVVGRRPAPLSVVTAHFPAESTVAAARRTRNARVGRLGSTLEQVKADHGIVATERVLRAGADVVVVDAFWKDVWDLHNAEVPTFYGCIVSTAHAGSRRKVGDRKQQKHKGTGKFHVVMK